MTDRRCYDVNKRQLSLLQNGDDGHLNGCERLWLLYMVSEQLGSNVVGLGSDFFYQVDGVQCALVGFVSRGLITLTEGKK